MGAEIQMQLGGCLRKERDWSTSENIYIMMITSILHYRLEVTDCYSQSLDKPT